MSQRMSRSREGRTHSGRERVDGVWEWRRGDGVVTGLDGFEAPTLGKKIEGKKKPPFSPYGGLVMGRGRRGKKMGLAPNDGVDWTRLRAESEETVGGMTETSDE